MNGEVRNPVPPDLTMDQLEKGRVYNFSARNFSYGVYDGKGGFIGIREKFQSFYLFTEYHYDKDPHLGTVIPKSTSKHVVPIGVEPVEYFQAECSECHQPVEFVPDVEGTRIPGRWKHSDRNQDAAHDPHGKTSLPPNEALFNFLLHLEPDAELQSYIRRQRRST